MSNTNPKNQFTKGDPRASEAGHKSQRKGPSIRTKFKKILSLTVDPEMIELLNQWSGEEKTIHSKIRAMLPEDVTVDEYIAFIQAIKGMTGHDFSAKLIGENVDGKPKETIQHEGEASVIRVVLPGDKDE